MPNTHQDLSRRIKGLIEIHHKTWGEEITKQFTELHDSAKKGHFHNFLSPYQLPKTELIKALDAIKHPDAVVLKQEVLEGMYDGEDQGDRLNEVKVFYHTRKGKIIGKIFEEGETWYGIRLMNKVESNLTGKTWEPGETLQVRKSLIERIEDAD